MANATEKQRHWTIPIAVFQAVGFGGLMALALSVELYIGISGAAKNTTELLSDKTRSMINEITGRIEAELDPIAQQARWIASNFADGGLDLNDADILDTFMFGTMAATPQLSGMGILAPDKTVRGYRREPAEIIIENRAHMPDIDQILARAKTSRTPRWGPPRQAMGEMVINHQTPLFDGDRFIGVLVQVVSISTLSLEITTKGTSRRHSPFILYDRTQVLAHPKLIDLKLPVDDNNSLLPTLDSLGDSVLAEIWSENLQLLEAITPVAGITISSLELDDRDYVFVHRQYDRFGPRPWTVGIYFNAEDENAQIERFIQMVIAGILTLIVALITGMVIGRRAIRPIQRLASAARFIKRGNLKDLKPLERSRLREFDDAAKSFNDMADGLRERERIRNLFGKFLPEKVASRMLRSDDGLASQSSEATILFADVVGFTTLSESLSPTDTVDVLNAYFTEIYAIIERHGGIITQFQGDGVLSVFNIPIELSDHAARAIKAARDIMNNVYGHTFQGQVLHCRIGINTGPVVAGIVGASGRMNYTVIGDAVNVAARLEQLNKEHGTHVLIAEETARQSSDANLREIDTVTIRGKKDQVRIYTLAD